MAPLRMGLAVALALVWASPAGALRVQEADGQHAEPADWKSERIAGPAGRRMQRPGMLHFMFLLEDRLQHPGIWGKFWSAALPGSYMAWAHCRDHHACENDYMMKLLKVRLVPQVFSSRGVDLVMPFAHMIRLAMAETQHLAASGVIEKFIVLSDATLPIKPFWFIHWDQTKRNESDICISTPTQWSVRTYEDVPFTIVKHHQWVSLSRRDAKALADDWSPVHSMKGWNVTLRTGKFASKHVRLPRAYFTGGAWFTATDEEAIYERAFGPMLLKSVTDYQSMYDLFYSRRCITYVDWPDTVFPQSLLDGHTEKASMLQVGAASERIFNATDEITKEVLKDETFRYKIQEGIMHPFMTERIGVVGLRALRESRYLFARKFSCCAQMPNFTDVMFSE